MRLLFLLFATTWVAVVGCGARTELSEQTLAQRGCGNDPGLTNGCPANDTASDSADKVTPGRPSDADGDDTPVIDPCRDLNGGCDAKVSCVSQNSTVKCGDCPVGYLDLNGDGTRCVVRACARNERVEANRCVPCARGFSNSAGDDPAGPDTRCGDACARELGISCSTFESTYLKASNTGAGDFFGSEVALDGDTLAVSAVYEQSNATGVDGDQASNAANKSGAVYVFSRRDGVWSQEAYLKASNTGSYDRFGRSLALFGDTLAVGAYYEASDATGVDGDQDNNLARESGAVYVFRRAGGAWSQEAYLKASNASAGDLFGNSVALAEDRLAVGAPFENGADPTLADADASGANDSGASDSGANDGAKDSGAVYVFARSGTTWQQEAYLKASNFEADDRFGHVVALSGATLAVGAYWEASASPAEPSNNEAQYSGAVYVFSRSPAGWAEQAYLKASNADRGDIFGSSLALSADTLAVGAYMEDSDATGVNGDQGNERAEDSGAVYVFTRSGTRWQQEAYLKASNPEALDHFGISVSLFGDTLAVGAHHEDSASRGLNGDQHDNAAQNSGAVYLFARRAGSWSQQAYLKASNTDAEDVFGAALALSSDTLAIGAFYEDSSATGLNGDESSNAALSSGAVYLRQIRP